MLRLAVVAILLALLTVHWTVGEDNNFDQYENKPEIAPDVVKNISEFYVASMLKGIMKRQYLHMALIDNPENDWHTCYFVRCEGNQCPDPPYNTQQFCYPAIVITGIPKCGTSALYDLLSKYKNALVTIDKENCPYSRRRAHWKYFLSFPRLKHVTKGKLIINGCIQLDPNIRVREVLVHPVTKQMPKITYIVLTRNYADLLWSTYNFWCKWEYDGVFCDNTRWVRPEHHHRSPEVFHDIVQGDQNNTFVKHPLHDFKRPCVFAGGYFSEWLNLRLWPKIPKHQTLIFASEQLESHPEIVASRIFSRFGIDDTGIDFKKFSSYRVNSQIHNGSSVDRGNPMTAVPISNYTPGLFPISGNRPMFPETREMLGKCWLEDCMQISVITGYMYPVCKDKLLEKVAKGELRTYETIYNPTEGVTAYK